MMLLVLDLVVILAALFTSFSTICIATGIEIKQNILIPPIPDKPFVVAWDVAGEHCKEKYGISINLSDFDIIHNENNGWEGDTVVAFYQNELGYYPHIDDSNNNTLNGGIPQLGDLDAHLSKAKQDILNFIPDPDFEGIALIDWEKWHPLWDRMSWGRFTKYQDLSIEKVRREHPEWSLDKITSTAKSEYETAARAFMTFTLSLARTVRPKALWGFYIYPDCYNYDRLGDKSLNCSDRNIQYNDDIQWVFDKSTALYPSIYLGEWFGDNHNATYYVANRVIESLRVQNNRISESSIPVIPYHLITYRRESKFLDIYDLRNSIGVASMLGASGVAVWGDHKLANSAKKCNILNEYVSNILGPYVKMTSHYAYECSISHCKGHGRCVLTNYPSEGHMKRNYLKADDAWRIIQLFDKTSYLLFDEALRKDVLGLTYQTVCQCYDGWMGDNCGNKG